MDAPPTPPPMTTALACCFKSWLGARLRGRSCCCGRPALGEEPVREADYEDDAEGELEKRDLPDGPEVGDVRPHLPRGVLVSDRGVAWPQEVDLHGDSVDEAHDVEPH